MAARPIPRNPNLPPVATPQGQAPHWRRLLGLAALLALIGYFLYARSAPIRVFAPAPERPHPVVTPALAAPQSIAPARPTLAAAQPVSIVAQPVSAPETQVRAAILSFNAAFRAARASMDAAPLTRVARGEWLAQEQTTIQGLSAQGITEQWSLLQLDIRRVAVGGARASACTAERWTQVQVRGTLRGLASDQSYIERYTLVWQADRWLVSQISYSDAPC